MSGSNSSVPASATVLSSATGAPHELLPLGLTLHSVPLPPSLDPALDPSLDPRVSDKRRASGRWKMLAVLLVCAAPVLASYFTYFVVRPQARTNYSEFITPTRELPESLPLRNLAGQPVPAAVLPGQWLLVVVADAACNAGCESHLLLQRQLRETLGREKDRVDKVWFVTDDAPLRPEVLQGIGVAALGADAASAGNANVNANANANATTVLRVPRAELARWLEPAAGRRLDEHLYVIDPMGQWMMRTPVNPDPAKFKRDIERLLRASASWDQPGR